MDTPRPLALWHLASLDAPTVAVVWALAFAWTGNIHLGRWIPVLLALVTWTVYVGDRLADARAALGPARCALRPAPAGLRDAAPGALRDRHFFHWRYRRIFLPVAIAAACASAGIVLALMAPMARAQDTVLAVAALIYFSSVHSRNDTQHDALKFARWLLSKELLVGVLFTAGCMLPSWPRTHSAGATLWPFWIPGAYFTALAWLNCSCIAQWERVDMDRDFRSRLKSTNFLSAALLALTGGLLAILAFQSHSRAAALLATGASSALLLAVLDRARTRLSPLALRACADMVLLSPLVLLLQWIAR